METKAQEQNLGIGNIRGVSVQKKGSCDTGAARILPPTGKRDEKDYFTRTTAVLVSWGVISRPRSCMAFELTCTLIWSALFSANNVAPF